MKSNPGRRTWEDRCCPPEELASGRPPHTHTLQGWQSPALLQASSFLIGRGESWKPSCSQLLARTLTQVMVCRSEQALVPSRVCSQGGYTGRRCEDAQPRLDFWPHAPKAMTRTWEVPCAGASLDFLITSLSPMLIPACPCPQHTLTTSLGLSKWIWDIWACCW